MKKIIIVSSLLLITNTIWGQFSFRAVIKKAGESSLLAGTSVSVKKLNKTVIADSVGVVMIGNIPTGRQILEFSYAGYESMRQDFVFPLLSDSTIEIYLQPNETEVGEVIVTSTRTSRTIGNTPTRIETIDREELDEKNNMRPANVSMLLHESTGIQVQQTSAVSGNASIRMQGLDGRYTQLLKDGYPNFGNFASGLSILEIPPLDLRQVEIIKGPASTLYGGGAIAGVVNFISKTPREKPELNMILNQSNIGQTNLGIYAARRSEKFGYTFLGMVNLQRAYDVDKDDFSDLPKSNNFTLSPRLYYYPDSSTTIMIGNSFSKGVNTGGDMHVIAGKGDITHRYFEKNNTVRNTTTLELDRKLDHRRNVKLKQALSIFDRKIDIPDYRFWGVSTNIFSDFSYLIKRRKHTVIGGISFVYDKFEDWQVAASGSQNTQTITGGVYVQDTWDINDRIKLESGFRFEQVYFRNINFKKSQFYGLPRISGLFKITDHISSRIGGGLGYKTPTIFTEQTETIQYQNVLPLINVEAEKSIGGTADLNYRRTLPGNLQFSFNQLFFYTVIQKPLILQANGSGAYFFANASSPVQSRGFETNIKLIFRYGLKFFLGYTYTDTKLTYLSGNRNQPLLPKNKLNLALVYEKENNFKIGLEGYFTDHQYLYNGSKTPSFWEFGLMAEKSFHKLTLFVNFENLTDQRQSRYKSVVNPPYNNPVFDDIWNHQEGFVMNGGIKLRL